MPSAARRVARSRSPDKENEHPNKKAKEDSPLPLQIIPEEETKEEAIAAANAAFGALTQEEEAEESAKWVSTATPQALVTTTLDTYVSSTASDLSHQLAHKFGCTNLYFKDLNIHQSILSAKKSGADYNGTQFVQLAIKPWLSQRFNHTGLRGLHLLMPICILSDCFLPPYGSIDEVNPTYPLTDKSNAKIKLTIRPSAYSPFSQTDDGAHDTVSMSAFQWFGTVLEPKIKQAMEMGEGTSKEEWETITFAKSDSTSIALRASRPLFRNPRPEERPILQQFRDKSFNGGYTEALNKICINKCKLMNDSMAAYRVTTQEERDTQGKPLLEALTWQQQTMLQPNVDEVMLLVALKAQTRQKVYKAKAQLEGLIWFGPSKSYAAMKDNSVEEKLRLVPPFPEAPTTEQLWKRKNAEQERLAFDAELRALRDERTNG